MLPYPKVAAQETFVLKTAQVFRGNVACILPQKDNGWIVFEPDSNKLLRFTPCGKVAWVKKYPASGSTFSGIDFFCTTRKNGFAFFRTIVRGDSTLVEINCLDSLGQPIWSRQILDPGFELTAYSLGQDRRGNFFLFAGTSVLGGGSAELLFCVLSETGNLRWVKRYRPGGFWGGAIATKEGGYLIRSGPNFLKTDSLGNLEWARKIYSGSGNYAAPVETPTGFVWTGVSMGNFRTSLFLLDKNGNPLRSGCQSFVEPVAGFGLPPRLLAHPQGGFAGLYNVNGLCALVRLDDSLQVLESRTFSLPPSMFAPIGLDLALTQTGSALVVGTMKAQDFSPDFNLLVARSNTQLRFECDSALSVRTEPGLGQVSALQASVSPHAVLFKQAELQTDGRADVSSFLCQGEPFQSRISLSGPSRLCAGEEAKLQVIGSQVFSYFRWPDGSEGKTWNIRGPGRYRVEGYDACNLQWVADSLTVSGIDWPPVSWKSELNLCSADTLLLDVSTPGARFLWQDGSRDSVYAATAPGKYQVEVEWQGCKRFFETQVADCEVLEIPNWFSPDGNGRNDRFVAKRMQGIDQLEMEVYNRWGQKVFSGDEFERQGWDGKDARPGLYFWTLRYRTYQGQRKNLSGTVLRQ